MVTNYLKRLRDKFRYELPQIKRFINTKIYKIHLTVKGFILSSETKEKTKIIFGQLINITFTGLALQYTIEGVMDHRFLRYGSAAAFIMFYLSEIVKRIRNKEIK